MMDTSQVYLGDILNFRYVFSIMLGVIVVATILIIQFII